MKEVKCEISDNRILIELSGHIDSENAGEVKEEIVSICDKHEGVPVEIDAKDLEYISSAGLRIILYLRKKHPVMRIINVSQDIYEILQATGFTDMMEVLKTFRNISVDNCEVIGKGANGTVYRLSEDTVVKIYSNSDDSTLDAIVKEREVARLALVLGVPTAISYEIVKAGDNYGAVYELLKARSFSNILSEEPDKMDWCVNEYVDLMRQIHGTAVPEGKLSDMRETGIKWAEFLSDYLPEKEGSKLLDLVKAIPHTDHMLHGDYHTRNIVLSDDEVLLIDMDTLSVGHPVYELASMYNAFKGFSELDNSTVSRFLGITYETAVEFWNKVLHKYLMTDNEDRIREVEDKARILGYSRMIRRSIRRGGLDTPEEKDEIDYWKSHLIELLGRVDSLVYEPPAADEPDDIDSEADDSEIVVDAEVDRLDTVLAFIEQKLEDRSCKQALIMQIAVAVEEIFVNIASYAYQDKKNHGSDVSGKVKIRAELSDDPETMTITFVDKGIPYDPLAKEDPDVTLSAEERPIGGLGIFMVKNVMDDIQYEYKDGKNILKLIKVIGN